MELLKLLEAARTPHLDTVFSLITRLGEETVGVAIFCLVFWCINKKVGYIVGISFFLSGLTVQGLKISFRIERPWILDPAFNPVEGAKEYATGYSFPSGHTQSATALYGSLGAQIRNKPIKAALFLVCVLVAFSRMYLGVHTLLDVAASLLISFLFIWLSIRIFTDVPKKKREAVISLLMGAYSAAVAIIAVVVYASGNGLIERHYVADCLKAMGAGIGFAYGMYKERMDINFSVKTKSIAWQVVKYAIGMAGIIIIKEGLKLIIGTDWVTDSFRYFLMLVWVMVIFPLIIKRFFECKTD